MNILGVCAYYHDSAAAIVRDGEMIAAAQEDRFSRKKNDARFPRHAVAYCPREAELRSVDIDYVAFYDKPLLKSERLLESCLACSPRGFQPFRLAIPIWLREKLFLANLLWKDVGALDDGVDWSARLQFGEHHLSQAASAYYPSPFDEALNQPHERR